MYSILILNMLSLNVPYYYNPKMHTLGNIGFGGKLHAATAPIVTKAIDYVRYNGINIREEITGHYVKNNKTILDLCCGVGISTAEGAIGVDTSHEMLNVAVSLDNNKNKKFYFADAELVRPKQSIDIVTCMFAFHEMPHQAQINVINNAKRIANEEFIIVDISPNYKNKNPPKIMLAGEPYLIDYLNNIEKMLYDFEEIVYVPNHVHVWKYKIPNQRKGLKKRLKIGLFKKLLFKM